RRRDRAVALRRRDLLPTRSPREPRRRGDVGRLHRPSALSDAGHATTSPRPRPRARIVAAWSRSDRELLGVYGPYTFSTTPRWRPRHPRRTFYLENGHPRR